MKEKTMMSQRLDDPALERHARALLGRASAVEDPAVQSAADRVRESLQAYREAHAALIAAEDAALDAACGTNLREPRVQRALRLQHNTRERMSSSVEDLRQVCAEITGAMVIAPEAATA